MNVRLETLEFTPAELEASRQAVEKMAYYNWQAAGCPEGRGDEFWAQAEREWIERYYVPSRPLDGTRPKAERQPPVEPIGDELLAEPLRSRTLETVETA